MSKGRPLRVCHLAYSFYETDNRVIRYAETLAARGDTVDVIALRRPGQSSRGEAKGVRIHRIQRRRKGETAPWIYLVKILWFFTKAFLRLTVAGCVKRYDVVHVHNVPDFLVFAALTPKLLGARVILDIHDIVPEFYAGKFGTQEESALFRRLLTVERLSCRFADHVIVANDLWHETLTRRSVPRDRCTAILNHPDLTHFRAEPGEDHPPGDAFRVLYPGSLNHHQGVDLAVAAFASVADRMPRAELHVYGDGPARGELEAQAAELGIADRVVFRDPVPIDAMPELMRSARLGVVPKRADGFGNEAFSTKILEFMACGVPVVVSRTRVDTHYFSDETVRFFTPGDVSDLGRSLLWAFEHPVELAQMASVAARHATGMSWQRHSHRYTTLVDGLSRNHRAR